MYSATKSDLDLPGAIVLALLRLLTTELDDLIPVDELLGEEFQPVEVDGFAGVVDGELQPVEVEGFAGVADGAGLEDQPDDGELGGGAAGFDDQPDEEDGFDGEADGVEGLEDHPLEEEGLEEDDEDEDRPDDDDEDDVLAVTSVTAKASTIIRYLTYFIVWYCGDGTTKSVLS